MKDSVLDRSLDVTERVATSAGRFVQDIKIQHTVFALPFAASAFFLQPLPWPSLWQGFLLIICMTAARSFAMGMNRVLDRKIDQVNPRTKQRMIPSGQARWWEIALWSLLAAGLFVLASFGLNHFAGRCSPFVLLILALYPFWKRMHWLTHFYLGMCLGLAPVAVCIALGYEPSMAVYLLAFAVALWTAGFDIVYSLQDYEVDVREKLKSVPSIMGPKRALRVSRLCFAGMVISLLLAGWFSSRGELYYIGMGFLGLLLAGEQLLIMGAGRSGKSRWLGPVFFQANAAVSLLYLLVVIIDAQIRGPL